jgi:hypothetical protein
MQPDKPRVIIACKVLQSLIEPCLAEKAISTVFVEYGLHRTPALMVAALQGKVDQVLNPSLIILGYGLCGNGLVGLKARGHTLIVPRVHDCITMFLGSRQRYLEDFSSQPGTYYLTKGWLESGINPLDEYRALVEKCGPEAADWIIDTQYKKYNCLVLVAPARAELALCRKRASEVADFCATRWGFQYEERVGSDEFVKQLVTSAPQLRESTDDFLVIAPGSEIKQEMYWRDL